MISVVIPLYNKEKQIAKTLDAVLSQSYQNFEIIIVNDGSTDKSMEEVKKFQDPRIRLIQQENAGVSAARNRGIEKASFDLIAFLDADDRWKPNYLQTQHDLSQKYPLCDVFACNYEFVHADKSVHSTIIRKLSLSGQDGILNNYFEIASCSHPPLWTSAIMVRKKAILSVNGFPDGVKSGEDLLTWARLACLYRIAYHKTPVATYNLGEGYNKKNLPPRRQDKEDPVGKGLKKLYKKYPAVVGLKQYISHWHKMRASVAIRYDERIETIREIFFSLRYNLHNTKVILFLFLVLLPKKLRHIIISYY